MNETLLAFFSAHERKPWRPGHIDCCMFLASWAIWLGHGDPAEHLRGAYATEDGFRDIISNAGGVVPVVAACVARIGGKRLQRPACGAIGVIGAERNIHRQFGAIHDGERWRVRLAAGIDCMTARPLAIWSI